MVSTFEAVKNKYKTLRFNSIACSLDKIVNDAESSEVSFLRFAEMLVEQELAVRDENKISLNMKRAGFPVIKQLEEFDFSIQTSFIKPRKVASR